MPGLTAFNALVDTMATTPDAVPQSFLAALRHTYELGPVLYTDVERHGETILRGKLIHDPNPPLERLVQTNGLMPLAPIFTAAANLFGPQEIDPRRLPQMNRQLAVTLSSCGLDRPMLIFPLLPSRPGVAFFSCNSRELDGFDQPIANLLRDLAALAGLFHARQLGAHAGSPPQPASRADRPRLTPREREVLQWVADGKTYWEIAHILDISERTVRHFMANCREKLGAVSNKQAVAQAVAGRLIEVRHTRQHRTD